MIDINSGQKIEAIYKMVQMKCGKKIEKFSSNDINKALNYLKWHVKKYKEGLLLEIYPQNKKLEDINE